MTRFSLLLTCLLWLPATFVGAKTDTQAYFANEWVGRDTLPPAQKDTLKTLKTVQAPQYQTGQISGWQIALGLLALLVIMVGAFAPALFGGISIVLLIAGLVVLVAILVGKHPKTTAQKDTDSPSRTQPLAISAATLAAIGVVLLAAFFTDNILALIGLGLCIVAAILGIIALVKIHRNKAKWHGKTWAWLGIAPLIGLFLLGLLWFILLTTGKRGY